MTTTAGGLRIRHANADDVPAYASFSRRLVIETFAGKNDPLEFAAYLEGSFGEARQAAELADPGTTVLLGEIEGEIAAFAYMRDGVTPECVTGPNPMEIARFYVDGRWHGRGLARTMMQAAAREAVRRGAETAWLGVWEHNPRAIAFYLKCGFIDVGSHVFMVGNDAQTDRLMSAPLDVVVERTGTSGA